MEKKTLKTRMISKALKLIAALSLVSFSAYGQERDIASLSISEASQRIKTLKKSLESTKGAKRGKIVKEIAELENKVLEKTLRSATQQTR